MNVAVNDISIKYGFENKYQAVKAFKKFANVCKCIKKPEVQNMKHNEIIWSPDITKATMIAPECQLIEIIRDMLRDGESKEQGLLILSAITSTSSAMPWDYQDTVEFNGITSSH